jgi:two-component system LytT family response regulator/two-component system response regulator AlgR
MSMLKPLRIALAEDEPMNLKRLARLLEDCGCQVVSQFRDGAGLRNWLEAGGKADALFLDVQMPGLDGLSLARSLEAALPVVFVTAHANHAVEAFDTEAQDFLLKPVTTERLVRALDRVRRKVAASAGAEPPARRATRFPIQAGEGLVFLELARTTHFEVKEEVVWAHAGERFKTLWRSLGEVEAHFPEAGLMRIQRHLLLRPETILGLRPAGNGRVIVRLSGGAELEASRGATPKLKERLGLAGKDVDREL